jgi:hypothetical protein
MVVDSDGWISSYSIYLDGSYYTTVSSNTTSYNIGGYGTGWHQVQVQATDNGGLTSMSGQMWFYYPETDTTVATITSETTTTTTETRTETTEESNATSTSTISTITFSTGFNGIEMVLFAVLTLAIFVITRKRRNH